MRQYSTLIPMAMSVAMVMVGMVNLFTGVLALFGVHHVTMLAEYSHYLNALSPNQVSNILAIFIGLALMVLGIGLFKRRRLAWRWSLVWLLIAIANSIFGEFVPQTFIIGVVYFVLLIVFNKTFSRQSEHHLTYTQLIAWISVVFALSYGVLGSYLLRNQFSHLHTWVDAFYYTVVTYSTVGYGDIVPITMNAKIFTISMIIVGISSFVATIGVVLGPLIEGRMKGVLNIMKSIKRFKNHVIICGEGHMAMYAAKLIQEQAGTCFFIVDTVDQANAIQARGFHAVVGSGNSREDLESAGLAKAKALISAYPENADNILTAMTASNLLRETDHEDCQIICKIDQVQNVSKAQMVGATQVATPSIIGGEMMAKCVLNPD